MAFEVDNGLKGSQADTRRNEVPPMAFEVDNGLKGSQADNGLKGGQELKMAEKGPKNISRFMRRNTRGDLVEKKQPGIKNGRKIFRALCAISLLL